MMSFTKASVIAAFFISSVGGAFAQQSANKIGGNDNWSVFEGSSPKECWAVSAPEQTVNTRGGRVVAVKRSEILLIASARPGDGGKTELSFTGGYSFAKGSTVSMNIGGKTFELLTDGEWAWPATSSDDAKIIVAMKRGAAATLTARSARGTVTKDTFTLSGFTAALGEAEKRC
ncbi:MAG: invasion associated locus B family protein [Halocynthiibacter sp.]